MADRGGQPGNQNAAKNRPWAMAIERALRKRSRTDQMEALDELAEKLLAKCDEKDMIAIKELGDRLDGKPAQAITGAGEGGSHIFELKAPWIEQIAKSRGWV